MAPRLTTVDGVNAPTLWEEGRWSAARVTRLSTFVVLLLVVTDLVATGGLGLVFDGGFVVVCVAVALLVRPDEFFRVGVLPPMQLFGIFAVLAVVHRGWIAPADDGLIQALISALAHHSGALLAGYALCLVVLAIRQRVISAHSNLEASPEPYRVTSGAPEVKSTTVEGSDPDSPAMTASST